VNENSNIINTLKNWRQYLPNDIYSEIEQNTGKDLRPPPPEPPNSWLGRILNNPDNQLAMGMMGPINLSKFRSMNEAIKRGAWNFKPGRETEEGYYPRKEYNIEPNDIPPNWSKFIQHPDRPDRVVHYDPRFAEEFSEKYEVPENYIYKGVRLKPDVKDVFPEKQEPGTIYRGMSWEDFQDGLKRGAFKSRGDYNIGPQQEGLTFYSSDPSQAQSYAHGFAPWQYKGTPTRPSVVIGVKDPGTYPYVTGQTELGLRDPVPVGDVRSLHVGRPAIIRPGSQDFTGNYGGVWREGGGASPSISSIWSQDDIAKYLGGQ
jgi:hypothetical protein